MQTNSTSDKPDLSELFIKQQLADQFRITAHQQGIEALKRLLPIAQGYTGQSHVVARFLLGCYNSYEFSFPLNSLRGLDLAIHQDCIAVLQMEWSPKKEVHEYFDNGNQIFEELAQRYSIDDDDLPF